MLPVPTTGHRTRGRSLRRSSQITSSGPSSAREQGREAARCTQVRCQVPTPSAPARPEYKSRRQLPSHRLILSSLQFTTLAAAGELNRAASSTKSQACLQACQPVFFMCLLLAFEPLSFPETLLHDNQHTSGGQAGAWWDGQAGACNKHGQTSHPIRHDTCLRCPRAGSWPWSIAMAKLTLLAASLLLMALSSHAILDNGECRVGSFELSR